MFYSQFGEDKILFDIFHKKTHGLCVEVGANDGINDSTSFFFEKLGWDCILIEPNPDLCKIIRASRNATLVELAASDSAGEVTLFIAEGAERAHGVSTISAAKDALNKIKSYGFTFRKVQVQTKTLDEILSEIKPERNIDFISVDVEGHELEVFKGFSIERWHPTVILAEDNSNYENFEVRNYLSQFGYIPFKRTGVNDWYSLKANHELASFRNRSKYHWNAFKVRTRKRIKKIPGISRIRKLLSA